MRDGKLRNKWLQDPTCTWCDFCIEHFEVAVWDNALFHKACAGRKNRKFVKSISHMPKDRKPPLPHDYVGNNSFAKLRKRMWNTDSTCKLCNEPIVSFRDSSIDHIIPRSKGGRKGNNLQLAHRLCNSNKGDQ